MKRCAWLTCEKPGSKLCGACGSVAYCSDSCQKLDWKKGGHKSICALKKAATGKAGCGRDLSYGALFVHFKSISSQVAGKESELATINLSLALLVDYASRSPQEREFSHGYEAELYILISKRYISVVNYIFDSDASSVPTTALEYLARAEEALKAAEAALAGGRTLQREAEFTRIEQAIRLDRCNYYTTSAKYYKLTNDLPRYLAEYLVALDLCRELPNQTYLDNKAMILYDTAWALHENGRKAEGLALLEEAYELQCCVSGPADYKLQKTVAALMQFYETMGRWDTAEVFARSALDSVLTHETDLKRRVGFEAFMSKRLAVILLEPLPGRGGGGKGPVPSSGSSSSSGSDEDTARWDEAETLLRRSVAIYWDNSVLPYDARRLLFSLFELTDLLLNTRAKVTPELGELLERELALSREVDDRERLAEAILKMMKYNTLPGVTDTKWVKIVGAAMTEEAMREGPDSSGGSIFIKHLKHLKMTKYAAKPI